MTRRFYVNYPRNFANEYDLRWVDNTQDETYLEVIGYERITRKHAVELCVRERKLRRLNPCQAGWASDIILPATYAGFPDEDYEDGTLITFDGYVFLYANA